MSRSRSYSRQIAEELGYEGFDRDTCFQPRARRQAMYSLFEMRDGKWVRISMYAFYLKIARNLFQDVLLDGAMTGVRRELRKVQS